MPKLNRPLGRGPNAPLVGCRRYHTILCKRMETAIKDSADSVGAPRRSRALVDAREHSLMLASTPTLASTF
jgi:hypothetical protein